ncbi:MAG: OmpH family outer membrane protein [Vampirovibrio sp.]
MWNCLGRRIFFGGMGLFCLIFSSVHSTAAWADVVGYVDYDKVRNGYEKAQTLIADIKVKEADLRKTEADFVKQIEDSRKANAKNPIATKSLEQQLETKLRTEVKAYQDWSNTSLKTIDDAVTNTIKKVAQQKGATVVVDQQAVIWGGVDLTPDIIRTLNTLP